jgi:glycosyltransferase involved in cell wall biosynthesis
MTKIIHIITRLDSGGSALNTLLSCLGLAPHYRLTLIYGLARESGMTRSESATVAKLREKAEQLGVTCKPLPSLIRSISPIHDAATFVELFRHFRREKPQIVHTHTSKAGILGRFAAKLACVPIIVHTPHGHVFYGHFKPLIANMFLLIEKICAAFTHCLIALTPAEKSDYIKYSLCRSQKIVVIHSGVSLERFLRTNIDLNLKKRVLGVNRIGAVVGTVGWLLPVKGSLHLLRAMDLVWKKHPQTHLIYVGKGALENRLKAETHRMGAPSLVTFAGWRNDVHEIMPVLDIFVLASLNEGMGRVLVEAMAAGRPIVASRTGGIVDLVKDGQNGLLVPPGDEAALADAIIQLLENPQLADKMGKNGKNYCKKYSDQAMVAKLINLYGSLLEGIAS